MVAVVDRLGAAAPLLLWCPAEQSRPERVEVIAEHLEGDFRRRIHKVDLQSGPHGRRLGLGRPMGGHEPGLRAF